MGYITNIFGTLMCIFFSILAITHTGDDKIIAEIFAVAGIVLTFLGACTSSIDRKLDEIKELIKRGR